MSCLFLKIFAVVVVVVVEFNVALHSLDESINQSVNLFFCDQRQSEELICRYVASRQK